MAAAPDSFPKPSDNIYNHRSIQAFNQMTDFNIGRILNYLKAPHHVHGPYLQLHPNSEEQASSNTVVADEEHVFWLEKEMVALGADDKPVFKTEKTGDLGPVIITVFRADIPFSATDRSPQAEAWLQVEELKAVAEGKDRLPRVGLKVLSQNPLESGVKIDDLLGPTPPETGTQRVMRKWFSGLLQPPPRQ